MCGEGEGGHDIHCHILQDSIAGRESVNLREEGGGRREEGGGRREEGGVRVRGGKGERERPANTSA